MGKDKIKNRYNIFGTSINKVIKENIIKIPNYIKIDVDGSENLILKGATDLLLKKELKQLSIEMNFGNSKKTKYIKNLLKKYGFRKFSKMNRRMFNDKNYIPKKDERFNVIFRKD